VILQFARKAIRQGVWQRIVVRNVQFWRSANDVEMRIPPHSH
jgi:hypothetical protein